jgi:hypothetical protein
MFFVGLVLPLPIGIFLFRIRRADTALSLIGLASIPVLTWGAALGLKIGPCKVGPCMTHTQHNHLVIAIVAFVLVIAALAVLGLVQKTAGGILLVVAQLVGAYSMIKTDTAAAVMLVLFAVAAAAYLIAGYMAEREAQRVPDYPPVA